MKEEVTTCSRCHERPAVQVCDKCGHAVCEQCFAGCTDAGDALCKACEGAE